MRIIRVGLAIALALASGCSSNTHKAAPSPSTTAALTAQERADQACRRATPKDFRDALPTTVAEIRAIRGGEKGIGGGDGPYGNYVSGQPAGDFAVWCWHEPSRDHYALLLITDGRVIPIGAAFESPDAPPAGPIVPQ